MDSESISLKYLRWPLQGNLQDSSLQGEHCLNVAELDPCQACTALSNNSWGKANPGSGFLSGEVPSWVLYLGQIWSFLRKRTECHNKSMFMHTDQGPIKYFSIPIESLVFSTPKLFRHVSNREPPGPLHPPIAPNPVSFCHKRYSREQCRLIPDPILPRADNVSFRSEKKRKQLGSAIMQFKLSNREFRFLAF